MSEWFRRRWLDFRFGHTVYLIFALTFANFILIFHRLLIEKVDALNEIFSNLWLFAVLFVIVYIPLSIAVGAWHRRTQLKVESEQNFLQNPFAARLFRVMLDMIDGKASKEEIEKLRNILREVEGRGDPSRYH